MIGGVSGEYSSEVSIVAPLSTLRRGTGTVSRAKTASSPACVAESETCSSAHTQANAHIQPTNQGPLPAVLDANKSFGAKKQGKEELSFTTNRVAEGRGSGKKPGRDTGTRSDADARSECRFAPPTEAECAEMWSLIEQFLASKTAAAVLSAAQQPAHAYDGTATIPDALAGSPRAAPTEQCMQGLVGFPFPVQRLYERQDLLHASERVEEGCRGGNQVQWRSGDVQTKMIGDRASDKERAREKEIWEAACLPEALDVLLVLDGIGSSENVGISAVERGSACGLSILAGRRFLGLVRQLVSQVCA